MEDQSADCLLLERLRLSDVEAFRVLFERYQPVIFRYVLSRAREPELAHDVVQDTFLRIWERRAALRPGLSFLGLAFRISGNLVRDIAKSRRTRARLQDEVPRQVASEGDDPGEALLVRMLEERILETVDHELPEKCRAVFLLSRFEGKGNREIAELLGVSVRTVENQINHALKVLRKRLGHEFRSGRVG